MQTVEHREKTLSWFARGLLTEKNVSCDGYTSGENMKSETWRCVELCIFLCVKLRVPYSTPMCSNSELYSDMFLV